MKDFDIGGFSYKESCELAREYGAIPIDEPEEIHIQKFKKAVDEVFRRINLDDYDLQMQLQGLFIFDGLEQEEWLKDALAVSLYDDEEKKARNAVIGMSTQNLDVGSDPYNISTLIHELAHLGGLGDHGEGFQTLFNDIEFDFYNYSSVRADSVEWRLKNTLRRWRR